MAIAKEHLLAIQQEIEESFAEHANIEIVALEGSPPEKYEITYHLEGLQKSDTGDIEKADRHTITLTIPFGFPHFPPSCKPKSPIFHPDFDPAAICIGDYWEKNRSIVELINYIGDMISGKIYSTDNAFNEVAAQWYLENFSRPEQTEDEAPAFTQSFADADSTPASEDITSLLDDDEDVEIGEDLMTPYDSPEDDAPEPALSFVPASEEKKEEDESEDLFAMFKESDFDFAEAETDTATTGEESEAGDLSVAEAEEEIDVEHLLELVEENRFFGLDKELSLLSAATVFDGKEDLAEQAAAAIEKARSHYAQALKLEHKGDPSAALEQLKEIETITSDYPGLKDDINRVSTAIELLGDWTKPTLEKDEDDEEEEPLAPEPAPKASSPPPTAKAASHKEKVEQSQTRLADVPGKKSLLIPIALGVILLLVGAAAGFNYYLSAAKYGQAEKLYEQCTSALTQNQFDKAEQQCEAAIVTARQITLFKGGERDALIAEINKTLTSEALKQGLAGNLLLDGKYYPKPVVDNILAFRKAKATGDNFFAARDWQQAIAHYQQALKLGSDEEVVEQAQLSDITKNIEISEFNIFYQSALLAIDRKEWVQATTNLSAAQEKLKTIALSNKAEMSESITALLAEISQATEKEKGDIAFAQAQWQEASDHYRKALNLATKSPHQSDSALYELRQLVVKGDLYATISTGKDAFNQAQWDKAIASYDQAIKILEDNRELLKQVNTDENRTKLARIMLQASVIRDKQSAARNLKEEQYAAAIDKLKAILDSISASKFKDETEFVAVLEETNRAIDQAEQDRLLADKIAYLEDNFAELFTKHYSGAPAELLTERTVVFEKKMGSKLLFRLQCVEVGRGRPLQLVMKYTHDLDSGEWSFYSDNQ